MIHAEEIRRIRQSLCSIYARHTGQTEDTVAHSLDRDNFMSPIEARDFGLVDEVIERRPLSDSSHPEDTAAATG
jgi:ATP-dependent Clp protease protease subunit